MIAYGKDTIGWRHEWWTARKPKSRIVASGWPHQHFCGEMEIRKYRGRFYCGACGQPVKGWCIYKNQGRPCDCELPADLHPARST